MATKNVNKTRLLMKHDIEANWLKAENFVPLEGEIIIYDVDETHDRPRIKVGDGKTGVSALPFEGSQPDWNANEGEEGYIENRTHWLSEYIEYFPEIAIELQPTDSDWGIFPWYGVEASMEEIAWIVPNKPFTITYNGVNYNCEFYQVNGQVGAGNLSALVGELPGNNEPFALVGMPVDSDTVSIILYSLDKQAGDTVTLKISNEETRVKKLDKKYLPDGLFYMERAQTHVIVPEQTLTYADDTAGTDPMNGSLIVGQEYTVVWDGVTYKCIAGETYYPPFGVNAKYLGQSGAFDSTPSNTDEPFMLIELPESVNPNGVALVVDYKFGTNTTRTRTISVTRNVPASKIPIEHLPIDYATDDEILEVLASMNALPVVTDADGAILTDENSNILLV